MKLGSLFDGIGGFPLAASRYGIKPVWASEIEPFPIEVTKQHFPNMVHLGDITQINGAKIDPVDIITAGSPCQDLSVAGKREGLEGERSGLFMDFVRIVREMREATNGAYPKFIVWENVPGAFSSNRGADFRAVLEEIMEAEIPMPYSGKWAKSGMVRGNGRSLAWRVLDAQYFGVPQRRKRIFLIADFTGKRAGEILFEQNSMRGDITESRKAWQEVAATAREGVEGASAISIFDIGDRRRVADENVGICPTLTTKMGTGGNNVPITISERGRAIPINDKATRYRGGGSTRKGDGAGNGLGVGEEGDPCPTITTGDRHAVFYDYVVRRLTPLECERLMGFPDDWTGVEWVYKKYIGKNPTRKDILPMKVRKQRASDTARYKALGNSVAVPCVEWIMRRLVEAVGMG